MSQYPDTSRVNARRRSKRPLLFGAVGAVIVAGVVAVVLALTLGGGSGSAGSSTSTDSGIYACQQYAGPQKGSDSPALVNDLKTSTHADLRAAGDAMDRSNSQDMSAQLAAGLQIVAACSHHGVTIAPTG